MKTMQQSTLDGLSWLSVYTAGSMHIWAMAGGSKASCRAHVMGALLGRKVPQAKAGVNAIREEFYFRMGIVGDCEAVREKRFLTAAYRLTGKSDHDIRVLRYGSRYLERDGELSARFKTGDCSFPDITLAVEFPLD